MLLTLSLIIGLSVFFISIAFLSAVIYHLFQYQMPDQDYKKPIAVIAVLSIVFIFIGYWIFSGVPWETL